MLVTTSLIPSPSKSSAAGDDASVFTGIVVVLIFTALKQAGVAIAWEGLKRLNKVRVTPIKINGVCLIIFIAKLYSGESLNGNGVQQRRHLNKFSLANIIVLEALS